MGDFLERVEVLEVNRADIGDDPHIRPCDPAHFGDFARSAHPHLEDADVVVRGETKYRKGESEQVVIVSGRTVDAVLRLQNVRDKFFGRGFPDAARNGHKAAAPLPPNVRRQILQRLVRILHAEKNAVVRQVRRDIVFEIDHCAAGAFG